ncbi:MAG TPA: alanine--glyoxylate aminotransferase family protein [Candidatus Angelobacter sp.]|jgi:alanine-glyoxylate transaminase/serine-glyoxylate transaminase/serine-pyruvate transaminase|nr:alanine--glyoxylate aminotransferase family protein [Candidatus Angelobacter sp.]
MPHTPLLMIPGPTPLRDDVRAALAEPVRSHTSPENAATMRRVAEGLRACFGTAQARVHVFAGSGTLAMEAAVVNHAKPGDRMVVCSQGYFGDRFAEIGAAFGLDVHSLTTEWGTRLDPERLRQACAERPPALVTITHVDTSTGVLADVATLARIARQAGAVTVLDGVCATAGVEERMDEWGVDVMLTGAQKALAVPPGLAILAVSERARERRDQLGDIAAYYADLRRWDAAVDDPTRAYFSTHATGLLRALEVALDAVQAETLPRRFARHQQVARAMRDGFAELGLTPFTDAAALAPTLSVLRTPEHVDEAALRKGMAEQGVVVAGCLGPFAGRGIRVGHMGEVGMDEVEQTLAAATVSLAR